VIYYVGMASPGSAAGAAGNYPELMRATVNALTDALIGTPQPIAAGVVSLQALFGVDATNSGSVTEYQNWADVVSGGNTGNVRSVLFAIITKTLHADPKYSVPSSTITPASPSGGDAFQAYTVPSAYTNDRFAVYESEVAVRNQIWPR
jgi:type IV pilus assembly protein PilW